MAKPEYSLASEAAERLGGPDVLGCEVRCEADLAHAVEAGLPVASFRALAQDGFTEEEIAELVFGQGTLSHRCAKDERLTMQESDRAAGLARTMALADRTFANPEKASDWLRNESRVLNGRRPIDLMRTQAGTRIVEDELARIAWGVPA